MARVGKPQSLASQCTKLDTKQVKLNEKQVLSTGSIKGCGVGKGSGAGTSPKTSGREHLIFLSCHMTKLWHLEKGHHELTCFTLA